MSRERGYEGRDPPRSAARRTLEGFRLAWWRMAVERDAGGLGVLDLTFTGFGYFVPILS